MSELVLPYLTALAHLGFKIIKIILEGTKRNAPVQDTADVTFAQNNQASPYEIEKQKLLELWQPLC